MTPFTRDGIGGGIRDTGPLVLAASKLAQPGSVTKKVTPKDAFPPFTVQVKLQHAVVHLLPPLIPLHAKGASGRGSL